MNAKEFQYNDVVINGFVALFVNLAILPLLIVMSFVLFKGSIVLFMLLILFLAAAILMIPGYFSQEPNEARVWVRINPDNRLIIRVFYFHRAY